MTSNVVCGYTGAAWEENALGQDACQIYAQLAGKCNPSFTMQSVGVDSAPYTPNNDACTCNVVAYNLQAGCAWCQTAIPDGWWLTEAQWAGNCTTSSYSSTGIPSSVSTSGISIPSWATLDPGTQWDPSVQYSLSLDLPTATGATYNYNTLTAVATNNPYNYHTTYGYNDPYYWDYGYYQAGVAAYAIALGVMAGLYALLGLTVGIVYWMRQKKRKAWYGPMAAYYRNSGGSSMPFNNANPYSQGPYQTPYENKYPPTPYSGAGGGALAQPLLYAQEQSLHTASPSTHTQSLYAPSGSPQPPIGAGQYTTTAYVPPGAGNTTSMYGGPGNTTSMYGAPPAGPPPGAGYHGAPGAGQSYSGRPEAY